jgi:hypothetical protein
MDKYIFDTNLFFNMETGLGLAKKTEDVVVEVTKIAKKLKKNNSGIIFMPPRAIDEFLSFFEDKQQSFLKEFLSVITIKSPDVHKIQFHAEVFYAIVEDIRQRSYRGLNIGEEEIKNAAKKTMGKLTGNKKEFEIMIGSVITTFRDRYRKATRFGFLDSLTDLDLIMLAKEQDGLLVSSDEGVMKWAKLFGVKEMPPGVWRQRVHQE